MSTVTETVTITMKVRIAFKNLIIIKHNKKTKRGFWAGVATDKLKKRHFIAFVAFLSLFLGTDKNYKNQFEKRQPVAFLSLFCRFFAFFSKFLWFSDLKIFLFGRNPLTFVPLRHFCRMLLNQLIINMMTVCRLFPFWCLFIWKCKKSYFLCFKKRQKSDKKSDKKATKHRQTPS